MSVAVSTPAEVLPQVNQDDLKRFQKMTELGVSIQKKKKDIAKQESVVADAKSTLDLERSRLRDREKQLNELQTDLDNIAVGKFVEKLPYDEKKAEPKSVDGKPPSKSGDEVWRAAAVESLGLKASTCAALVEAGLETVGKIADFTNTPNKRLLDIKGIGKGKVEEIDAALEKFFEKNPQQAGGKMAEKLDAPVAGIVEPDKVKSIWQTHTSSLKRAAAIDVTPRTGGLWCYTIYANPGHPDVTTAKLEREHIGDYRSEEDCILGAVDALQTALMDMRPKVTLKCKRNIDNMLESLDKLDVKKEKAA